MTPTCKGCAYRSSEWTGDSLCDYLNIVGHSRGCPAEGCPYYTKTLPKQRKKKSIQITPAKPEAERQLDAALIEAERKRYR